MVFEFNIENFVMKAKTGEKCPVTGIWEVQDCPSITFVFNEGSIIPDYKGNQVYWEFKDYISG